MKNQDINQLDQSIEQLEDFLTKAKETRQTITQLIDKAEPIPSDKPELPSVAYLTMAWIPEFTLDNIISAIDQDYPAELKTLYLLNQAPYPIHYDADAIMKEFGLKIVEIDVPGTWPAVWMGKLKKFLDVVKEQVVVVFDEGKRYRHTYTRISIDTLYQNNAKACWNHDQILCKRTENKPVIEKHHYKPPYGTMAIKIHFLRQAAAELNRQFPKQLLVTKGDRLVPLDGPLCQIIEKMFPGEIIDGEQQRFYKFHSKSNSYMNKHRTDPSENIDVKR